MHVKSSRMHIPCKTVDASLSFHSVSMAGRADAWVSEYSTNSSAWLRSWVWWACPEQFSTLTASDYTAPGQCLPLPDRHVLVAP